MSCNQNLLVSELLTFERWYLSHTTDLRSNGSKLEGGIPLPVKGEVVAQSGEEAVEEVDGRGPRFKMKKVGIEVRLRDKVREMCMSTGKESIDTFVVLDVEDWLEIRNTAQAKGEVVLEVRIGKMQREGEGKGKRKRKRGVDGEKQ